MQDKLLKKIIPKYAGSGSEKLVDLLYNKQNVNEFLIAKKLNLTINQTRNMLYKLGDEGLVEFVRKKDKKKGGWYTYFWTLKIKKSLEKYKEELSKGLEKINNEIKTRESQRFYYSPSINVEYTEEEAMLNDFICPETGEVLHIKETESLTKQLKVEAEKIQQIISQINKEIEDLEGKEKKVVERKLKAEQKKKDLERKIRKLERDKLKKKLMPKKKPAKKKPAKKNTKKSPPKKGKKKK